MPGLSLTDLNFKSGRFRNAEVLDVLAFSLNDANPFGFAAQATGPQFAIGATVFRGLVVARFLLFGRLTRSSGTAGCFEVAGGNAVLLHQLTDL